MRTSNRVTTATALIVALMLCGCGGSKEEPLASAKSFLAKNDRQAAIVQLKNELQKRPDNAEARFLFGKTLLDVGDPVAAIAELRRARDMKYPPEQVMPLLLESLIATQQFKLVTDEYAAVDVQDALAKAKLKTLIATAYSFQGMPDKAETALLAALKIAPNYVPALILTARMKAERRQLDEAFAITEQAIAADPLGAQAWLLKGDLLLFFKGDASSAKVAYDKALQLKVDYFPARFGLLSLLLATNDIAGAEAQIQELRKTHAKHPQTQYFEAQLAFLRHDYVKARAITQQLLNISPDSAKVLQLAGAIAFNNDELQQSEKFLGKALQLSPELPVARALLAKTQLRSNEPDKALTTLKSMLTQSPLEPEAFALAGEAYLLLGDMKQAEMNFSRAATLNPKDSRSRAALALARTTPSNADATLIELRAISSSDTNTYADLALVSALLRMKDFNAALKAIDAIDKKQPDKPLASNLRGQIFLLRKDVAQARSSFERALVLDAAYVPAAANLANLDLAENHPEAALKRFESVLAADPKNIRARLAVAGLKERGGASEEVVANLLASAVKQNPTDAAPRLVLIEHYLSHHQIKPALSAAQDAVAALPNSLEVLTALGQTQFAAGELNQAIASFNKLVTLKPNSPEAYLLLAGAYVANKNSSAAVQTLKHSLEATPDALRVQQALIELYLAANQVDEAITVARDIQRQHQEDGLGFVLEANIEAKRGRYGAASEIYKSALKKFPNTEFAVKLHSSLGAQQKDAEANGFAELWLKDHPNDPGFLFYLAQISIGRNDFIAAEEYLKRGLQLKPNNPLALNNLAWVTAKLGKPGAMTMSRRANDLLPNTPILMDTLATILAGERQFDQAIDLQKKALSLAKESSMLRLNLAKIYLAAGQQAAARAELEAIMNSPAKSVWKAEANAVLRRM